MHVRRSNCKLYHHQQKKEISLNRFHNPIKLRAAKNLHNFLLQCVENHPLACIVNNRKRWMWKFFAWKREKCTIQLNILHYKFLNPISTLFLPCHSDALSFPRFKLRHNSFCVNLSWHFRLELRNKLYHTYFSQYTLSMKFYE